MMRQSPYYEHSGVIGMFGPILMILFGLAGAVAGGAIYGYLIFYIPFIYLNFFITLGFGALVGYLVGMGAKIGKIRNVPVTLIGEDLLENLILTPETHQHLLGSWRSAS